MLLCLLSSSGAFSCFSMAFRKNSICMCESSPPPCVPVVIIRGERDALCSHIAETERAENHEASKR